MRDILHIDMNNFYASVECMLDSSLKGKAVAVGGNESERKGIILAKNYEARAYGIKTGDTVYKARQKCRDLIIVPPHYEEYVKFSKLAKGIYKEYTDKVEPFGLDECWLDVTHSRLLFGDGVTIGHAIMERIKRELGLTVSVGVSFNKTFAKLGSDMKKPYALTHISKENFREKVWGLNVNELLWVGRSTKAVLNKYNINTIGDLALCDEKFLKAKLMSRGVILRALANGDDNSPVMENPMPAKSVGHGITTVCDLNSDEEVFNLMLELSQSISKRLREKGKMAGGLMITVKDNALFSKQWQTKLSKATYSAFNIASSAFELFKRVYEWEREVRAVSIQCIYLVDKSTPFQLNMFEDKIKEEKLERLEDTVCHIRARFGKWAIQNGNLCGDIKINKDHVGISVLPGGYMTQK